MSSRIPLAATSTNAARDSALIRTTALKIKRKSLGLPSMAAKRARATTPAGSLPGPSATPATASRVLSRPMTSSMTTGRATTTGIPRSIVRPPSTLASRARPSVDTEKEEMRRAMALLNKEKEDLLKEKEELKGELAEKKSELQDAKTNMSELKADLMTVKGDLKDVKRDLKDIKDDLKAEKEAHNATKLENEGTITRLRREAIDKDEQMRILHNDVVDLRGRIRVSVRVRPLLGGEIEESTEHLTYPDTTTIGMEQQGKMQPFTFNNVYGPNYSQERIFDGVKDLIMSVMHGFNVSLISYGQTGSGKTHTMRGGEEDAAGLIPRAVLYLFENRRRLEDLDWKFEFGASFVEVYNDECYDLLSMPPRAKREIKEVNNKFIVENLTVEPIENVHRMADLLRKSDKNRSTAATKCNETSSRSHAIFSLSVKGINGTTGANIECELKLVDLAGSERAKESGAIGDRFTEMTHINTALSNLQTCIRAILTKQSHVPYRNSKLTRLLQDSLRGGSKCMVILSLSPQGSMMNETKRTLDFGRNLSQTHIGAAKKKET